MRSSILPAVTARLRRWLVAPAVAAALAALLPALVLAHHPGGGASDPRCAEWQANGAPAGIDLSLVCLSEPVVPKATGDPAANGLLPYVGAALAFGVVLAGVAVVAWRATSRPVAKRLPPVGAAAWWACPSCRSLNATDRIACYACRTPAPGADATLPADAALPATATVPMVDRPTGVRT